VKQGSGFTKYDAN